MENPEALTLECTFDVEFTMILRLAGTEEMKSSRHKFR